jgi:hypothetical protein
MSTRRPPLWFWLAALVVAIAAWWLWSHRTQRPAADAAAGEHVAATPAPLASAETAATRPGRDAPEPAVPALDALRRVVERPDARPHEAVLTFADAGAYARFLERAQQLGLTVLGQLDALRTVRIRYTSLADLLADLARHAADYSDVSANYYVRVPQPPAKAERAASTAIPFRNNTLPFLGVPADHGTWGRGATIAVLDTGVAPDPSLEGRVQWLNLGLGTLPGSGGEDGHGTAVAALAAGAAADAAGVAPAASILSIRATDANSRSDVFTIARAIVAAVDARASIINISLGGYQTTLALTAAIDYATAHDALIIAAAGNDQAAQLTWPAADPRVVSVGAVDAAGRQVAFSNSGPQLQIAAPGYGVQTAWLDARRVYVNGTSASAPLVAGAIAAVMGQTPGLKAADAWDIVRRTTADAGASGADADYGAGVLDVDWAMNASNPAHTDPAIASHYYDAAHQQLDVVVQNRSAVAVSGLSLEITVNGFTSSQRLPDLAAGASHVATLPVDPATLAANDGLTLTTRLVTPYGVGDTNVANDQLTSHLAAPAREP